MTLDPLEALASQAPRSAATSNPSGPRRSIETRAASGAPSAIVTLFQEQRCYGRELATGKHAVLCPWAAEHSELRSAEDSDTVIWEAGAGQVESFHCLHDHCHGRTLRDVYALWRPQPTPAELFAGARTAEAADRRSRLKELAQAVASDPLEAEAWARQVREAGLSTKGAFSKEVEQARRQTRRAPPPASVRTALEVYATSAGPYRVENGGLCVEKDTRDGPVLTPLCNFDVRITGEVSRDNGVEERRSFTLAGTLQCGTPLPPASVPTEQFPSMNWVTPNWGNPAVVYAGIGTKDHARAAIQLLSGRPPRRTIYEHLGWRKIGGEWIYLHGAGAIGTVGTAPEVEVALEGKLGAYSLPTPAPGEPLAAAVHASLSLLLLAREELIYPLLAAIYRAPLAEALSIDCSVFLAGGTGCQKTELSALAQAHYGAEFHGKHLPGNWVTSENSLEKQAFLAKDALFTVDDFAPGGTSADVQRLHQRADRIFRGQGNKQGRGRMRPDGTLRQEYYPRGLVLSSGEDIPNGQSCRARLLVLEMCRGDVNLEQLTLAQRDAREGLYALAMAGYLQWLAPQMDLLRASLRLRHEELRAAARQGGAVHDRVPDNLVSLALGLQYFLLFAVETGAITTAELDDHWSRGWHALLAQGARQGTHLQQEEPTARFLSLLAACLAAGHAHVAASDRPSEPDYAQRWGWQRKTYGAGDHWREDWQPQGKCVGWVAEGDLFLQPEEAFAAVQRLAHAQGSSLPVGQQTLWKRLGERGFLASREEKRGRNTVRRTLAGMRREVIHLRVEALSPETVPTVPTGPANSLHARSGDSLLGRKAASVAETVPVNRPTPAAFSHRDGGAGSHGTVGTRVSERCSSAIRQPGEQLAPDSKALEREVIEL